MEEEKVNKHSLNLEERRAFHVIVKSPYGWRSRSIAKKIRTFNGRQEALVSFGILGFKWCEVVGDW